MTSSGFPLGPGDLYDPPPGLHPPGRRGLLEHFISSLEVPSAGLHPQGRALLEQGLLEQVFCSLELPPAGAAVQMAASSGAMRTMPTPVVMHPNLVNTMKYMIELSPTSSDQSGSGAGAGAGGGGVGGTSDGSGDELLNCAVRRYEGKRKVQEVLQQQQRGCKSLPPDLYSPSGDQLFSQQQIHFVGLGLGAGTGGGGGGGGEADDDDDEAAVVPVDLIQNRRPFKCAYAGCNKTFKNPQTMKMHRKTHYSEDSACRLDANAAHLNLSSFRAGHNKKIPSRCPTCRKTFVGLYELRRHFGRKHSVGEKKCGCKKCGKRFYIEVDLRDHEKLCGELIECKCGMKFAFKCNLVAHKKGHVLCQDPPMEEDRSKKHGASPSHRHRQQQQQARSSRSIASAAASVSAAITTKGNSVGKSSQMEFGGSITSSPTLPFLMSDWSPTLSQCSDEFSSLPGFTPQDILNLSSDCSYPSMTSPITTPLPTLSSPCSYPSFASPNGCLLPPLASDLMGGRAFNV